MTPTPRAKCPGDEPGEGEKRPRAQYLIVEDNEGLGRTLKKKLERWGDAIWARTFDEAIAALMRHSVAGLLVDVRLPGGSGFEVLQAFRAVHPRVPAMVLTGYFNESDSRRACELGAYYVAKPVSLLGIQIFMEGTRAPTIFLPQRRELHDEDEREDLLTARFHLTPAERKVYVLLAEGGRNCEIAGRLFVSVETVRTHLRAIFAKLGANSRTHAIAIGRRP
jgi:DNA-binding NarL/FixJ family response regulator